jgi:AcrR family transcriptional regulator
MPDINKLNVAKGDLRVKRTHKLLLDALSRLLMKKPYNEIQVMEICKYAMIHRTTFYKHFEDKDHLVRYAVEEIMAFFEGDYKLSGEITSQKDLILSITRSYIQFLSEHKKLGSVIMLQYENASLRSLFQNRLTSFIEEKQNSLQKGTMKAKPLSKISIDFIVGGINAVLFRWLEDGMRIDAKELLDQFNRVIVI